MAITQKWHTARGTPRDTERAAQVREDAENLAVDAQREVSGLPFKLAADMLEALMSKGKLVVPLDPKARTAGSGFMLRDATERLFRPGDPPPEVINALVDVADRYDEWAEGRVHEGRGIRVEWVQL